MFGLNSNEETRLVNLRDNIVLNTSFTAIAENKKLIECYSINENKKLKELFDILIDNSNLIKNTLQNIFNVYSEHYYQQTRYDFEEIIMKNIQCAKEKNIMIDLETYSKIISLLDLKEKISEQKNFFTVIINNYLTLYMNK